MNLLTCRPGFEEALVAEWQARRDGPMPPRIKQGAGWVAVPDLDSSAPPLIFERQRILGARALSEIALRPFEPDTLKQLFAARLSDAGLRGPWTLHLWTSDPEGERTGAQLEGISRQLMRLLERVAPDALRDFRKPEKILRTRRGQVLQLCITGDGAAYYGWTDAVHMTELHPGGLRRMKMDPGAPSRSYLKIEEALDRLGIAPQTGDQVVDLGAAPGGWSWAFARRGCKVRAVDNGPMKLGNVPAPGEVIHLREEGLTYLPEDPVDWMICDMLIPPGKVMGLLRRWFDEDWAQYYIFNVKLPQQEAYAALLPLRELLDAHFPGKYEMRQLYHDRREVTVYGPSA